MSFIKIAYILASNLFSFAISEEDFGFDHLKHEPLQRLWGIPDVTAQIGYLFHYEIPKNAFYGKVAAFKAYGDGNTPLPPWLVFLEKAGIMEGVPSEEDLGEHYITIKAFDDDLRDFVKDIFALEVLSKADFHQDKNGCRQDKGKVVLSVILDADYRKITPLHRIKLIKLFSTYFSIPSDIIYLNALEGNEKFLNLDVIDAGPGNSRSINSNTSTSVNFQVGCHGSLMKKYVPILDEVSEASKNSSLSETLNIPVIGWKIWREKRNVYRKKREVHSMISSDGEDAEIVTPEPRSVVPNPETPSYTPGPTPTIANPESTRHHRHYHGMPHPHSLHIQPTSTLPAAYMSTPTYIPNRPSSNTPELEYERNVSPTITLNISSTVDTTVDQETNNEIRGTSDGFDGSVSSVATPPLINTSFPDDSTPSTNSHPKIGIRLQKLALTAGKVYRYRIPQTTFMDEDDGDTRYLKLKLKWNATADIPPHFWIQYDDENKTIYALPLDSAISKWNFELVAYDSGGLYVQDNIEIRVQDNKARRAVNHAITMELLTVPPGISLDWEFLVIEAIREKFGDPDASKITVLNVTTKEPYTFTWTNDSLPRNECPLNQINNIFKILTDENGLKNTEVHSGLKIGNISWTGIGLCESKLPTNKNFAPFARNPVDYLNATVGQLLVFPVPEDSFYDHEDGSARSLKLSLTTKDGEQIPHNNWLQFDVKNQEFYGIPMSQDVGQKEYLLVCKDKGGLVARDNLVVNVHSAPPIMYNVEFSMKLNLEYNTFVESPSLQRSFVEKLARVFGDQNTNAIVLSGLSPGSTVITWHNKSLPTNSCPDNKIKQLRQLILGDDERLTTTVERIMGEEFPVISARLTPTGLCQGALIEISSPVEIPSNEVTAVSNTEHYIIGLIVPLVVITVMLLCAGLVACILYRRRRTGKMSVGDEDERQTFRSKGIPVIFQDELDERPEPTNKSPVIMKEEKPPLPPPEYQRGAPLATTALLSDTEDTLYQPPPPFTTSRDSARPKPTPTYRMPPPYVPP